MGVLNVTPDSFADGGRYLDPAAALARAEEMAREGADIIDVGGESTRPGAAAVSVEEELSRVLPVIRSLARATALPISVDTTKSRVAEAAVDAGARIVNDVSGLSMDPALAAVCARSGAALLLGHLRGIPRTMQEAPRYDDVVMEVRRELALSVDRACDAGVPLAALAVDPGIGFGKLFEHNVSLLRGLPELAGLGLPVVIGVSRKSMTGHLDGAPASERLPASLAAATLAIAWGADVVRAHDVRETRQAVRLADRLLGRA
jgi:dihydropteroate synthase